MTDHDRPGSSGRERVTFRLETGEDGFPPANTERLWAVPMEDGTWLIDNTPFFTRDVSSGDRIAVTSDDTGLCFSHVVQRGGHSTMRVVLFGPEHRDELRSGLVARGCGMELSHLPNLLSVDLPPEASLEGVRTFLRIGAESGKWDWEEPLLQHADGT
jgi:hypothetical protein